MAKRTIKSKSTSIGVTIRVRKGKNANALVLESFALDHTIAVDSQNPSTTTTRQFFRSLTTVPLS